MPIGYNISEFPLTFPLNDVSTFNLLVPLDDIINEPDGLLCFTLQTTPGSELPAGLFLTNPLEVTVQDGTGKQPRTCIIIIAKNTLVSRLYACCFSSEYEFGFEFTEFVAAEFRSARISVAFSDRSLQIANPIGIQVTSLTVADSEALGSSLVIPPPQSSFSPSLAGGYSYCIALTFGGDFSLALR